MLSRSFFRSRALEKCPRVNPCTPREQDIPVQRTSVPTRILTVACLATCLAPWTPRRSTSPRENDVPWLAAREQADEHRMHLRINRYIGSDALTTRHLPRRLLALPQWHPLQHAILVLVPETKHRCYGAHRNRLAITSGAKRQRYSLQCLLLTHPRAHAG